MKYFYLIMLKQERMTVRDDRGKPMTIEISKDETQLRQRVYNACCKWNDLVDNEIEDGEQAVKNLEALAEKEKLIEESDRPLKEKNDFN